MHKLDDMLKLNTEGGVCEERNQPKHIPRQFSIQNIHLQQI